MTHDELVEKVARAFHDAYEAAVAAAGWKTTQEDYPENFDDLSKANKRMELVAAEAAIAAMREVLESLAEGDPVFYLEDLEYIIKAAGMVAE